MGVDDVLEVLSCKEIVICEMVEIKLVIFLFILEYVLDEVLVGSFEIDLFFDGIKCEDVYIVSLLKSVRKYLYLDDE